MATPQAKRLRSSCSDEPATPSTPQPQIPALSNSFVGKNKCSLFGGLPTPRIGCPINSVDNLELFKLQVRAIPELVEVFQTVPELSDFAWLGGSANGNEASSKFNLFSKVQPLFLVSCFVGEGLTLQNTDQVHVLVCNGKRHVIQEAGCQRDRAHDAGRGRQCRRRGCNT